MQFIPSKVDFSPESEKFWQGNLGMIGFEDNIVFTKASLIQFLKTHDISVDPNGTEIKKLPKYAKFGKLVEMQQSASDSPAICPDATNTSGSTETQFKEAPVAATNEVDPKVLKERSINNASNVAILPSGEQFRPTRKVRELPGGGSSQITSLFAGDDDEIEPTPTRTKTAAAPVASEAPLPTASKAMQPASDDQPKTTFRPTRKVRELPGGGSRQISALFGGDD